MRALVNPIDPVLFGHGFESWIAALWPDRHEFIAVDGKSSRGLWSKLREGGIILGMGICGARGDRGC